MLYQYVCPDCGDWQCIRISSANERNASCTSCGWIGDSSTAADEADEVNREESKKDKDERQ